MSNYKIILLISVFCLLFFLPAGTQAMEVEMDELELLADELILDDLNQQLIAIDNVKLIREDFTLSSDRLKADDLLEMIEATGSVKLERGKDILSGEKLELDLNEDTAWVTGNPAYKSEGLLVKGDEFNFNYQTEILLVSGQVSINDEQEGLDASAKQLEYKLADGEIILTGEVEIKRERGLMTAERVVIDAESRQITASKNPRLIIN